MTEAEFQAILQVAFTQCEAAGFPLDNEQKQILLQVLLREIIQQNRVLQMVNTPSNENSPNPLDELSEQERQLLLEFIQQQEQQQQPWKIKLLNDWLRGENSGSVQFIRDRYGVQWLESIQPFHLNKYAELINEEVLKLKVGDRIEVSNGLWEWVQADDPASEVWFPCLVIGMIEAGNNRDHTSCVVRFDNGAEYEIQGVYEWNRHNWRWAKEQNFTDQTKP
jgi:hypothetical protein